VELSVLFDPQSLGEIGGEERVLVTCPDATYVAEGNSMHVVARQCGHGCHY
jgi:hypothetical protein